MTRTIHPFIPSFIPQDIKGCMTAVEISFIHSYSFIHSFSNFLCSGRGTAMMGFTPRSPRGRTSPRGGRAKSPMGLRLAKMMPCSNRVPVACVLLIKREAFFRFISFHNYPVFYFYPFISVLCSYIKPRKIVTATHPWGADR